MKVRKIIGGILVVLPFIFWGATYAQHNCGKISCYINVHVVIGGTLIGLTGLIMLIQKNKE